MKIIYDLEQKEWLTTSSIDSVTFGKRKQPIKNIGFSPSKSITFHIEGKKDITLIGILTGRKKDNKVTGNGRLFKELQKEIMKSGGLSVVFTPQNIKDDVIEGFLYQPERDKWYPVICPLPHVIYNRVPFRRLEKSKAFKDVHQFFKNNDIPFFNTCFLDKYELYQILSRDPYFQELIPETMLINGKASFQEFLYKHRKLYLKPALGSKGKGIYCVHLNLDQTISMNGLENSSVHESFHHFWMKWSQILLKKSYIAQKEIKPILYKGKRFDFRILVHYCKNRYTITGIGIRQSEEQDITTHIPNGGKMIPYEHLQTTEHDQFITNLAKKAGKLLSKQLGFFGEFSIDAGLTETGKYVIYEINSKPMQFDEQEIEKKRFPALANLFMELAGYN
ncbi:YheC/YheD family protein [Bacillus sp. S/N-304-OC-R1]|uniref:YheC/YheD family endospore coat-associated protein n=1 Tax=Bacillus sp. S/N-304-OC-R1 TaxID=2758034 RepID=UPI001C8D8333|nr:YheC/YheD family protein [Bacillus sp. S/N-304-OC-R1]MBY0123100.1 YheC/YheD family protein [Bacillus sp. S/N-304-OC-R1]